MKRLVALVCGQDKEALAKMQIKFLEAWGWEVRRFSSPKEFIAALDGGELATYTAVVSEENFPGSRGKGSKVAAAAKAAGHFRKICLVSGGYGESKEVEGVNFLRRSVDDLAEVLRMPR